MKIVKFVLLSATILMMIIIYMFSAQPADESTEVSNGVGAFICRVFIPGFQEMPKEQQKDQIDSIDYAVRKSAHAAEYMILSMLCCCTLLLWFHDNTVSFCSRKKRSLLIFLGWLIAAIYSVSDEIHQIFVPGRAFMVTDILIDSAGALIGALIFTLIVRAFRCRS